MTVTFRTLEPGALIEFKDSAGQRQLIWGGISTPPDHLRIGDILNGALLSRPDCAALARFLIHFAETGQFPA